MNLKLNAVIFIVGAVAGGLAVSKLSQKPQEIKAVQSQVAEISAQKKSVIKEFNCSTGALSKETSIEEATEKKTANVQEVSSKNPQGKRDNVMIGVNSKYAAYAMVSPIEHVWVGAEYQSKEIVYKLGYSTRIF